ncbi:MAG: family peptidase [Glaciihabitans sp.]|nr:family peptidase [Glaciihabitans sp.]
MLALVAAAIAVSVPRASWQVFGLFTTLVHELGHAFAALLSGRRVTGIHLHRNHGGSAVSVGRGGLGPVVSGFFGYPAPAIVGAGLLWAVFTGFTGSALLAGSLIIVLTLLFIRNWFGALVVLVSAAVSWSLWWFGSASMQSYVLLVLGIALVIGAVRALVGVINVHTRRRSELASSDAYLLYRRTGIPSPVWLLLFSLVILGSAYAAGAAYTASLT